MDLMKSPYFNRMDIGKKKGERRKIYKRSSTIHNHRGSKKSITIFRYWKGNGYLEN